MTKGILVAFSLLLPFGGPELAQAQAPMSSALLGKHGVSLHGEGLNRDWLNWAAEEIRRHRRFRLVGDLSDAQLAFTLGRGSASEGLLVLPIPGVGLAGLPLEQDSVRLVVQIVGTGEVVWDDHREINWFARGAVKDLLSDLHSAITEYERSPHYRASMGTSRRRSYMAELLGGAERGERPPSADGNDPRPSSAPIGWARRGTPSTRDIALAAERGNTAAQFQLGLMYRAGESVAEDDAAAVRWFIGAAEQGHAEAQLILGDMFSIGEGVAGDDATAAQWYRRAADQGLSEAQFKLAVLDEAGRGVVQDHTVAARWYLLSAEQGATNAQARLGGMYFRGEGVVQDYLTAHVWLNLAAARSKGVDRVRIATARDEVAARMTPQQISDAQRLARSWQPKQ